MPRPAARTSAVAQERLQTVREPQHDAARQEPDHLGLRAQAIVLGPQPLEVVSQPDGAQHRALAFAPLLRNAGEDVVEHPDAARYGSGGSVPRIARNAEAMKSLDCSQLGQLRAVSHALVRRK